MNRHLSAVWRTGRRMLVILALLAAAQWACAGTNESFTRDIRVASGETAPESLITVGGRIVVDGETKQDVVAIGGSVEVNGVVGGNVLGIGATIRLGERAEVRGELISIGSPVDRPAGAKVQGQTVYINSPHELMDQICGRLLGAPVGGHWSAFLIGMRLVGLFTWFLIAVIVVLAFPAQVRRAADEIPNHFLRFGVIGLLWTAILIVVTILLTLLCLLLVGIPLLLILVVFAVLIKIFGNVSIFYFFGRRILQALDRPAGPDILAVVAGLAVLGVVHFIPYVGWILWTVLGLVGMGATLATKFGTGQPWFGRA